MAEDIKGKQFIASRGFYGTNSISFKGIELEVTRYNHDYANPVTSFDWGSSEKGSKLLAYAILNTIATPTIARVYTNKYTLDVIEKIKDDEWKMDAIEVARWVNSNTDYQIDIDEPNAESIEKEKRKQQREEDFQKEIAEKLKKRSQYSTNIIDNFCTELKIRKETLAKILDISSETLQSWQSENKIPKLALKAMEFYKAGVLFKEQNSKLKIESKKFQEELVKNQTEISLYQSELRRYKEFINSLNMPNLCKIYKTL